MTYNRVSLKTAIERLEQFHVLAEIISYSKLRQQLRKDVKDYSLITGWLTTSHIDWENIYKSNTKALETALNLLKDNVDNSIWNKICKKIRVPSDRAEFKAIIAELSLATFLIMNNLSFCMEIQLNPPKDIDFVLDFENFEDVYIEIQSLAESDMSKRSSKVSADLGGIYIPLSQSSLVKEENRIVNKIFDKIPKFTTSKITLVALDCTAVPEHGGIGLGTIPDAINPIFSVNNFELSSKDSIIRRMVDGVIWFQVDYEDALQPHIRGTVLNQHSPHFSSNSLQSWKKLWSS